MVLVHQSARNYSEQFFERLRRSNFVTPKNYLDFVANYKSMLGNNRENVHRSVLFLKRISRKEKKKRVFFTT